MKILIFNFSDSFKVISLLLVLAAFSGCGKKEASQSQNNPNFDPRSFNAVKVNLSAGGDCGGFVAADGLVITAGHCFDLHKKVAVTPVSIEFSQGETRTIRQWERYKVGADVSAIDDLAWITFDGPLPNGYQVIPIVMNPDAYLTSGGSLHFQGYTSGPLLLNSPESVSRQQLEYRTDLRNNLGVDLSLDEVKKKYAFTQGKRLASGDSGGPLYVLTAQKKWVCVGVLSGHYSADPDDEREIFTVPGAYASWIESSSGRTLPFLP